MIPIKISPLCSCAKNKKSWNKSYRFETLKEAQKKAEKMCDKANANFCQKHIFTYEVKKEKVSIFIDPRKKKKK